MNYIEGKVNKYKLISKVKERDGLTCGICGESLEQEWDKYTEWLASPEGNKTKRTACNITLDHKIPRGKIRREPGFVYEKGWQWKDLDNLQLAHSTCNNAKADRTT